MVDFHAHLLPAMDDGSDSVSTSLRMLEMWTAQGIDSICATPHFYADRDDPDRFLARRAGAMETLAAAIDADRLRCPAIRLGAEVHYFGGIASADGLESLCLTGTKLLLLEMPFSPWSDWMMAEVASIRQRGLYPVAAHVERYFRLQTKPVIRKFMDLDILIQCNAGFFLSRRTRRRALSMLREARIHFLGSDAHGADFRPPNLGPALSLIEKKLGPEAIDRLLALSSQLDERPWAVGEAL